MCKLVNLFVRELVFLCLSCLHATSGWQVLHVVDVRNEKLQERKTQFRQNSTTEVTQSNDCRVGMEDQRKKMISVTTTKTTTAIIIATYKK